MQGIQELKLIRNESMSDKWTRVVLCVIGVSPICDSEESFLNHTTQLELQSNWTRRKYWNLDKKNGQGTKPRRETVRRYTVASLFMWSGLIASTIRFGYALEWEDVENSLSAYWVERLPLFICNICWVWYSTGAQTAGHVVPSRPGSFCSGGDDSGQHRH